MMACSSTSLMAAWAPPKPPMAFSGSLASTNSVFFSNGAGALSSKSLSVVSKKTRGFAGVGTPSRGLSVRCLFGLGVPELAVIAGVAALVFGPKKLPEIGRSIGKTVKSFQQAAKELETELKKPPEDAATPTATEIPKAVSSEEEKKELEASTTKEST
ncbi:sec-independent protein translocase protein TATA, chloroplastic [Dioscorea cayenensis subsp. rotundata]|uniref:Sec-independent protein translocase protein TATA, chloroplastic n=1 Tax=Dioscorea cayennensis subsp. rotundata TaxID=55577 RepID=A0AB40CHF3_DIOCR|nr:sec-independent protein translocase protein TATA, chloroplastic [Dioscorea cayenensis subsp. rotundata]